MNLKRKTAPLVSGDLDDLIRSKKQNFAKLMGIRRLTYHLRRDCRLWISRQAVNDSLKVVDVEGLELRHRHKLTRRIFGSPGRNHVWSLDGHDKLSRWGFHIHGGIDVYSRYLIWLRVGASNNDPRYILAFYLDGIEEAARESGSDTSMSKYVLH